MTITTCPKCGSMNITTAGTCANCGWSQFAQVTKVSTPIEDALRKRIAELEKSNKNLIELGDYFASEIVRLNARIAELEVAQRWIPVSERLPEPNQSVLVFDRLGDMTIDFLVTFNREGVAYYTNSDDGAVCWMPLPEPPEVQE